MASNAKSQPPPASNGVITAPPKSIAGGNRKKQKRRAKQAAKQAAHDPISPSADAHSADVEYDEDALGYGDEDDYEHSDAEHYHDQYIPPHAGPNGYSSTHAMADGRAKNKKKKTSAVHHAHSAYNPELLGNAMPPLPTPPHHASALRPMPRGNIWNTSTQQERQNIKDFWLGLSEEERKSLLKIEKEAVLRKMKQQQKHSCSCTVCGRKRTAIEEELEVLYEGYYEELEQYAHHDHPPLPNTDGMMPDPLQHRRPQHPLANPPPPNPHLPDHRTSQMQEHFDDEEYSDEEDDDDEEEYSDDYSDEEPEPVAARPGVPDFFSFGQNLTVKDNLLTVADDLLKNDGRKFIEMMEQLAERRMARESDAEYNAANPSHPGAYPADEHGYQHDDRPGAGDEFEDDEASYDSQEDEFEDDMEEDEMGGLSEEQRMQEGRRMFQIFAARMFEQRVLTAYKEKVAAERQQKLLEELQDEEKLEAQREIKKQKDAQKKKDKKKQQQQAKAEEKAKKDAEKAVEEARAREAEALKQGEQRRRREEQRKKKEEEKRKQEDEKARKEAEKTRRQLEEQHRREEAERKAREQKAAEKTRKEEARKREREEREAREKEARERKTQEENEKKEREAKSRAEKEAKERQNAAQQAAQPPQQPRPPMANRASQAGMVAVPGALPKQPASGISSPHLPIATPVVPKAPTPVKPRQASQQGSHASSPKQPQSQVSSAPSKSSSPSSAGPQPPPQVGAHKPIMQRAGNQQPGQHPPQSMPATSPLHHQPIQPPPGMPHPQQHPPGFGGMPTAGYHGYQGPPGPMMHGNMNQRPPMMFPNQGPPMGMHSRFGPPGIGGMTGPPPGMMGPHGRGMNFPPDASSPAQPPPGFGQQPMQQQQQNRTQSVSQVPVSAAPGGDARRPSMPTHSRQQSATERFEATSNQPVSRPAPIQRPSSVKPPNEQGKGLGADVDDLSKHLGSSALLDDADDPVPTSLPENRRQSNIAPLTSRTSQTGLPPLGGFGPPGGSSFGAPGSGWNTPSLPFGSTSNLSQQSWGSNVAPPPLGSSTWTPPFSNAPAHPFATPLPRPAGPSLNRPLSIRLAICHACKQLAATPPNDTETYHPIATLLRQIDANRPPLDAPPTVQEIEEICETEGDPQNGGGDLLVRRDAPGARGFAVRWAPGSASPRDMGRGSVGLGEIGSPMPRKIAPETNAGFGAPGMGRGGMGAAAPGAGAQGFQSLGAVGSPTSY